MGLVLQLPLQLYHPNMSNSLPFISPSPIVSYFTENRLITEKQQVGETILSDLASRLVSNLRTFSLFSVFHSNEVVSLF